MKKKRTADKTPRWTAAVLDYELLRRSIFPPNILPLEREEFVTVADLHTELQATPVDHPNREWREWELALAQRQAVHNPGRLFYRVVSRRSSRTRVA